MNLPNRRLLVKLLAIGSAAASSMGRLLADKPTTKTPTPPSAGEKIAATATRPAGETTTIRFSNANDRVFLGGDCWANPMEDWCIRDGKATCLSGRGRRNVHSIVHEVDPAAGGLVTEVTAERAVRGDVDQVGIGFGSQSDIRDYRANCFVKKVHLAGVDGNELVLMDQRKPATVDFEKPVTLKLAAAPVESDAASDRKPAGKFDLTLTIINGDLEPQSIQATVSGDKIAGNLSLVNSMSSNERKGNQSTFGFGDWTISGAGVGFRPERRFGPILWTMYSVDQDAASRQHSMRLTAIMAPVGEKDSRQVHLQLKRNGQWQDAGEATIDPNAFTATFAIDDYDARETVDYRVMYHQTDRDGNPSTSEIYPGEIKADPAAGLSSGANARPLRVAAMTCQNDYGFPYAPVAENIVRLNPDLIYFSGDQIYESHGGYGIIREPADRAIINYLRKFYQFGWSFRESMAKSPTLCIPDDHDVFQGNIWGEGGRAMAGTEDSHGASDSGGYREPAAMVNVVHRTCTSHHPPADDPSPSTQDISVYYGTLLYGGVGFAILGDRQWKSGPRNVETGSGRADHVYDMAFDTRQLDKEGLQLLGERQDAFLNRWVDDFQGHQMKVLLSQTVFAGVATHHGSYDGLIKADLDSGGWPQTARDRAIDILRRGKVLHINGDQHLATMSQYGVREPRDSNWSFCTPAISAGYPRWWRPDEIGMPHEDRPEHGLPNTGQYRDGFENLVYVYCHGNPEVASKKNRYEKAHQKGSGFGMVTIDSASRTYRCEAFRFLCDAKASRPEDQFDGWPLVIHQDENAGLNRIG